MHTHSSDTWIETLSTQAQMAQTASSSSGWSGWRMVYNWTLHTYSTYYIPPVICIRHSVYPVAGTWIPVSMLTGTWTYKSNTCSSPPAAGTNSLLTLDTLTHPHSPQPSMDPPVMGLTHEAYPVMGPGPPGTLVPNDIPRIPYKPSSSWLHGLPLPHRDTHLQRGLSVNTRTIQSPQTGLYLLVAPNTEFWALWSLQYLAQTFGDLGTWHPSRSSNSVATPAWDSVMITRWCKHPCNMYTLCALQFAGITDTTDFLTHGHPSPVAGT